MLRRGSDDVEVREPQGSRFMLSQNEGCGWNAGRSRLEAHAVVRRGDDVRSPEVDGVRIRPSRLEGDRPERKVVAATDGWIGQEIGEPLGRAGKRQDVMLDGHGLTSREKA